MPKNIPSVEDGRCYPFWQQWYQKLCVSDNTHSWDFSNLKSKNFFNISICVKFQRAHTAITLEQSICQQEETSKNFTMNGRKHFVWRASYTGFHITSMFMLWIKEAWTFLPSAVSQSHIPKHNETPYNHYTASIPAFSQTHKANKELLEEKSWGGRITCEKKAAGRSWLAVRGATRTDSLNTVSGYSHFGCHLGLLWLHLPATHLTSIHYWTLLQILGQMTGS